MRDAGAEDGVGHLILSPDPRLAAGAEQAQQGWIDVKAERRVEETEPPVLCSDICATAHQEAGRRMELFRNLCAGNGSYTET